MKQRTIGWIAALVLVVAAIPCRAVEPAAPANSVLRATLSNGLRVVIVPNRLAPVVTTEMNYLAGSNDAPDGFPGTAHAVEHMMFRGSEGLDKDQLAELGALLGGTYNADTTETVTQYSYTVPADNLDMALRIEALRMRGLSLKQADWDKERGAIEQEVSGDLSSPFYNFMSQAQAILFEHTPYEHDALGTRPSFDQTDAALLRGFYEKWYAPNNAILVIVGDVRPADALVQAQAAFDGIPSRDLPAHKAIVTSPVQLKTLTLETNFPFGLIALAYRMPGLNQRDFAAADILSDVLSSERGALYDLVPDGKALFAEFTYQAKADVGFGLAMAAFPIGDDPAPLLANVRRLIADAARDGVSADLVAAAKRQELAQLAFNSNSISGLAESWSRALAFRGDQSPDDVARAYASVTVEDVDRLARLLLDPDHAVTAILTPRESAQPVAGSGFGGTESFDSPPDHAVTLPSWAAAALAQPHVPDPGDPPDVSTLPNGLRLIVQPEHVSPTVSVYGSVRQVTWMQEPAGKEGVAALTRGLFEYGTESRDRLAFRKAVDAIAARINAGPEFSLQVLTPDFEDGMRLLAENELHPAFPSDAFTVVRGQLGQSVGGRLHTPGYLFRRAVTRAVVPEGDPTLRQATPDTVMALRPEDVHAYYAAAFRPDLTTIVVVGDVTAEQARRVVNQTFGSWQATGPAPAIDLPPIGPNKPSRARVQDSNSLQDSVSLAETFQLPVTSPDRYALLLGNTILGSGFSSRLYQDLRIKSGYVYSVSSDLDWSRIRADYSVSFGADGENVDKARALVLRDLREMQTNPVSASELARAKAELLRRLPMQRASIGGIAGEYLRLVELGLPLDSRQIAAAQYLTITAADIQRAFAAWIRPDDLALVVKGPVQ
ncbi:M16 family metallopeptidase [Acidisphaera sp. S103]|uniref:M16 family metallopeptidase n=1 Tax=Acidisphaera sp. S103 TaxID=1747223 RepID=UPI00352D9195